MAAPAKTARSEARVRGIAPDRGSRARVRHGEASPVPRRREQRPHRPRPKRRPLALRSRERAALGDLRQVTETDRRAARAPRREALLDLRPVDRQAVSDRPGHPIEERPLSTGDRAHRRASGWRAGSRRGPHPASAGRWRAPPVRRSSRLQPGHEKRLLLLPNRVRAARTGVRSAPTAGRGARTGVHDLGPSAVAISSRPARRHLVAIRYEIAFLKIRLRGVPAPGLDPERCRRVFTAASWTRSSVSSRPRAQRGMPAEPSAAARERRRTSGCAAPGCPARPARAARASSHHSVRPRRRSKRPSPARPSTSNRRRSHPEPWHLSRSRDQLELLARILATAAGPVKPDCSNRRPRAFPLQSHANPNERAA